jgi:hypothetical protein
MMTHLLTAVTLFAATACADSTAPRTLRAGNPLADADFNETEPSAMVTQNPCNSDVVELAGTLHILLHSTTATSDNQHFYLDLTSDYSGLGEPSAVTYTGGTRTLNDFTTNASYPIVYDSYQDILLHSSTNEDNYALRVHFKITINANSVPTATIDDVSQTCTG